MELSNILNRDIDLIDLQNVNDVFKFEIVTKGKKIQHSKFGDNFENRIWWIVGIILVQWLSLMMAILFK